MDDMILLTVDDTCLEKKGRKEMKKITMFVFAICAMFLTVKTANAADIANELPHKDNENVITLTGDVTLSKTFEVNSSESITIDLAGYTLTGPSNGYTIDNKGSLMIKDSGEKKGKIVGAANNDSSAVRNIGKLLQISGVTIESPFICVKNEPDKVAVITDSSLTSTSTDTHTAILNYGDLAATNSIIKGTNRAGAVLADKDSKTTLTNCTVSATTPLATGTGSSINMVGGSLEGKLGVNQKGTIKVTGDVSAKLSSNISRFLQSGAKLTISGEDVISQNYEINEGVTLVVSEDADLNFIQKAGKSTYVGSITVKGGKVEGTVSGAKVYNETNTTYYGLLEQALVNAKADTTNNLVLLDNTDESQTVWNKNNQLNNTKDINLDLNGHTVKGNIVNNVDKTLTIVDETGEGKIEGIITNNGNLTIESEDKELVKNEDGTYSMIDKKKEENNEQNPNTYDSSISYIVLALLSLCVTIFLSKKLKSN